MLLFLRCCLIFSLVFADDLVINFKKTNLNTLLLKLSQECNWKYSAIKTKQQLTWNESYSSCESALSDIQKHYPVFIEDNTLKLKEEVSVFFSPEYFSIKQIKKSIKSIIKDVVFFDDINLISVKNKDRDVINEFDKPPKQIHLRAVLWTSDEYYEKSFGLSSDLFNYYSFDDWVDYLHSMHTNGLVNVIAEPELYVMQGKKASISSGEEIPYQTSNAKESKILFKKALLSLTVKAENIGEKGASLDVFISFDKPGEHQYQNNVSIARQSVKSFLRIDFNKPLLIGGVKQTRSAEKKNCLPFFSKDSFFGDVFCYSTSVEKNTMLFVLLFAQKG